MKAFHWFVVLTLTYGFAVAQEVEHNYLVGPQNTNCDSLSIEGCEAGVAIRRIQTTAFRLDRQFTLRRPSGLQGGWLYSCDNQSGYLIVRFDGAKYLYTGVPIDLWDAFVGSGNPEQYYLDVIRKQYKAYDAQPE